MKPALLLIFPFNEVGFCMIYTIGHSTHPIDHFLELLGMYSIGLLVDVRSVAASRYNPQFNKRPLGRSLENFGITYEHKPEEFGARQTRPEVLDEDGRVDFDKVRYSRNFLHGMDYLMDEIKKSSVIVLMCSEGDPLECHRFGMISVALVGAGVPVGHILNDGTLRDHTMMEDELIKRYRKHLPVADMFTPEPPREEKIRIAQRCLNQHIGYRHLHS